MEFIKNFLEFILHLDLHLTELVLRYGILTYGILFFIIFAETGFVITPFLPGDSLLFAAGAIAALGSLNIFFIASLLITAAILGDTINYWLGHFLGRKIVSNPNFPLINQEHITKTEQFFKKYGGKTIILARFVPIVRTFAPFVAGVGAMAYKKFILFNIIGGISWVSIFTFGGYLFGNLPLVKNNFHYVIFIIIFLSLLPAVYEYWQNKKHPSIKGVSQKNLKKLVNQ